MNKSKCLLDILEWTPINKKGNWLEISPNNYRSIFPILDQITKDISHPLPNLNNYSECWINSNNPAYPVSEVTKVIIAIINKDYRISLLAFKKLSTKWVSACNMTFSDPDSLDTEIVYLKNGHL